MEYQRGRGGEGPGRLLESYKGALQSDGYKVYDHFDLRSDVTTYGCWVHARRYFFDALKSEPERAPHALEEIRALYEIERILRQTDPSPENRCRVRQEEALPILERFKAYLQQNRGLPKSPWGQAVTYALGRWDKLTRYMQDDGRIEIDNNLVENALRPIALGRNYAKLGIIAKTTCLVAPTRPLSELPSSTRSLLHARSTRSTLTWLTDVLARIPTHPHKLVHEMLPHRWTKSKV